jgi:hypothetical protein
MVLAALAASSVACGNSMSTTGPSGVSGGSGGGAVISGRVTMSGSGASSVSARAPLALAVLPMAVAVPRAGGAAADAGSVTVTIVGTGVSTTLDGSGSFTLDNVPPGTVTLNFKGRGADAMLTISGIEADDRISIAVTLNGSSARLDKSEKTGGGGNGNGNLVNGRIDSIDNGARSFRVDAQTVFVPQGTTIRHGNRTFQFSDLRVGDHVQVKGTRNGSMVTASEIKVEQGGDDDDDDDDVDRTTFRGSVSLLTGLCPGLTLTVAGTRVVTNAATQFDDVTCATLRNEMTVEVTGIRRSDGSVLATEIDREDSDTTEVRGTVSLLIGLCPGLTFTAAGTQIVTNAATQFEDVTCATLTNTMLVEVQGLRRSDGSILASKIDRD